MSIAVSTTEDAATLARLGDPFRVGDPPDDPPPTGLTSDDLNAFRESLARASLGLFLDPETRGVLTSEQHLEVCGRAGREALAGRLARRLGDARANAPEEVP